MQSALYTVALFFFLFLALNRVNTSPDFHNYNLAEEEKSLETRNPDQGTQSPHCLYVTNSANSKLHVVDVNTKNLYAFLNDNGQVQTGLSVGKNPTGSFARPPVKNS